GVDAVVVVQDFNGRAADACELDTVPAGFDVVVVIDTDRRIGDHAIEVDTVIVTALDMLVADDVDGGLVAVDGAREVDAVLLADDRGVVENPYLGLIPDDAAEMNAMHGIAGDGVVRDEDI